MDITITARHRLLLRELWNAGPASRWELHQQTRIRPNTIGADAASLIEAGLLREADNVVRTRGRPRVPLEIDPAHRHVLGVAILPDRVEAQRLNLLGRPIDSKPVTRACSDRSRISATAGRAIRNLLDDQTLAVGIALNGSFDRQRGTLILANGRDTFETSLAGILNTVGTRMPVFGTTLQARAAHWVLNQQPTIAEDLLLVQLDDGQVEAVMLGSSRPTASRIVGNSQLGHMQLVHPASHANGQDRTPVNGAVNLQTLFSSRHLAKLGRSRSKLATRLADLDSQDTAVAHVLDGTSTGLANAVHFAQPEKVVITGLAAQHASAFDAIVHRAKRCLPAAQRSLTFLPWVPPEAIPAQHAGWLALAEIYLGAWAQPQSLGTGGPGAVDKR